MTFLAKYASKKLCTARLKMGIAWSTPDVGEAVDSCQVV